MYYKKFLSVLIIIFMSVGTISAQKSYNVLMNEGNSFFENNKYDAAVSKFMEATKRKANDYASHYNLGNALYKSKNYEEAKAEYEKANQLSKTNSDKASSLHNLGNAYMQMNQPEKAAEFYKQSLKQEPNNEATRKNFEIAKLKQKENQEKQNQKSGEKNDGGKKDQQQQQQGEGDKKKADQKSDGQGNQQDKGKGKDGENPTENENGNLPKGLQNAILNKISERERETARRLLNKESYSMPESNEKDW